MPLSQGEFVARNPYHYTEVLAIGIVKFHGYTKQNRDGE